MNKTELQKDNPEMSPKDVITFFKHRHLDGTEPKDMVYFTTEDVHEMFDEYLHYTLTNKFKEP